MVNNRIEDIKWVENPWNYSTRINQVTISNDNDNLSSSSSSSEDNSKSTIHEQIIKTYNNGLIIIDNFLPEDEYEKLLNKMKEEFKEKEEKDKEKEKDKEEELDNLEISKYKQNQNQNFNQNLESNSNQSKTKTETEIKSKSKSSCRKAIHYGPKYDYKTNHATLNPIPVPKYIQHVINSMNTHLLELDTENEEENSKMNQATLQFYPIKSGIPPHIDTHSCFSKFIISFSLGSLINMSFQKANLSIAEKMFSPRRCLTNSNGNLENSTTITTTTTTINKEISNLKIEESIPSNNQIDSTYFEIQLKSNSLCIMTNEIRFAWTHGIKSRATDLIPNSNNKEEEELITSKRKERFSITFRKVDFNGICNCKYPIWCDSQQQQLQK
ncbi:uncharacterized protein I206_105833 [Kwoniella pini CBS 10737]|uniref:Fe2OG dioxygenase domain-containing protein n=1 Tax=Kwoniella pini CBS 10737 TaxID=1296096 RepID=A0A1B9I095_9TREE|nr:uncharacterized protein I206_04653 [Kwoniella pini CBS 10737]OCF48966.1 hypothetical protein I206_04653 [Kwoniella pini CBS 10737]